MTSPDPGAQNIYGSDLDPDPQDWSKDYTNNRKIVAKALNKFGRQLLVSTCPRELNESLSEISSFSGVREKPLFT
jgi:hypothetical protein